MILLLDPTSDPIRAGVGETGTVDETLEIPGRRTLSDQLLRQIDRLCGQNVDRLSGIGVVIGPGSFTSLRISLAVVNALAEARQIPLVGVPAERAPDLAALAKATAEALETGQTSTQLLPAYGKPPTITAPRRPVSGGRARRKS